MFKMGDYHQFHQLSTFWTLWSHLPNNKNWNIESYLKIDDVKTVEELIALNEILPPVLIKNCMFFFMKENIQPMYEDTKNIHGGYFSYKISNDKVDKIWKKITSLVVGQTICNDDKILNKITGITISPKKKFCILKIWFSDCNTINPLVINYQLIKELTPHGCLFSKHKV
jgi:hypothetical protein